MAGLSAGTAIGVLKRLLNVANPLLVLDCKPARRSEARQAVHAAPSGRNVRPKRNDVDVTA